jgi:hypothetical protein
MDVSEFPLTCPALLLASSAVRITSGTQSRFISLCFASRPRFPGIEIGRTFETKEPPRFQLCSSPTIMIAAVVPDSGGVCSARCS